ncbi:hypothetical protein M8J76_002077 [Diaphorina citri]|nr:hypothetical protein M8J76_002077 [Diaphorina citri]
MSDGNKKSGTLTGLAKGLFGGNDKEKKEEAEKKNNEEDSGFKAGDLLRPEKIVKGAKDIVYAVKPDAVDWIDWKEFPYHSIKFKNDVNRILERKQYDVNQYNNEQKTALHVVVAKGDKELVLSILAAGAALELKDGDGNTPLHIAAQNNSVSVTQALLGFGAEVNVR